MYILRADVTREESDIQGLKLAVAHSPFASKFQCGPLKISSQSSTWRVKIRKNKSVNLDVIIPIHQDRNPKNIDISIDRF